MPPRRNARSPPRVQPQHDQDADIREIWDGLNELETDQAEEIRLIRDRLNTLEKKHDELLRLLCFVALFLTAVFFLGVFAQVDTSREFWAFSLMLRLFGLGFGWGFVLARIS